MSRLHPLFADILRNIEQQPLQLKRAADKASDRRFTGEPISAFAGLYEMSDERRDEIWDGEREDCLREADQQRDAREARELGE